ncbi:hypothetical protein BB2000_1571 [Proteus mirabilis BB2000]|nr:hypothetical protein BB2000_1571 [Proteus mirabilis BB2000]
MLFIKSKKKQKHKNKKQKKAEINNHSNKIT